MEIDTINPYVMKIIIAARKEDSINKISKRINLSYGWTYKWMKQLIKVGVFKRRGTKVILNHDNKFYRDILQFVKDVFGQDITFHYSILQLFGIKYCFTKTDAVFVWTKGGYNIARYKEFYPIFIKVKKEDCELFKWYCKKIGLEINKKKGVFYQIEVLDYFDISYCEGIPVDSLDDTIKFMQKYIYNFEPALEMVKEMYKKKIKVKYKEVVTNV